jgi:predicted chitinase
MVGLKVATAYWKNKGLNELSDEGGLNEETL